MADWLEIKVLFDADEPHLVADLIADVFYGFGLKGVVVDDPELVPDEGWGSDAVQRPERHAVTGYFPGTEEARANSRRLESKIRQLGKEIGFTHDLNRRRIDEEEWAESWKTFFWPEHITDRIVVKPTWREYTPIPDEIVLEIDPGMAFGTGTHPTTAMCVHQIEKYLEPGATFLDVGTGSGILMLAAAKMGAQRLLGIDNDETAVRIAEENMRLNLIDPGTYQFRSGHLVEAVDQRFGFITANILFDVVMELLDTIHDNLKKSGILVCSGIIRRNAKTVTDKMTCRGYDVLEVMIQEEWVCIAGRYSG
jgi:ribosomal protein L11 methyltransferase